MGRVTLTLPRLGETMDEARVVAWLVAPGAEYRRGDVLMEVETDKTTVEVPALADGRMVAHRVEPGEVVALGAPIAEVESAAETDASGGGISAKKTPDEDAAGVEDAGAARGPSTRGGPEPAPVGRVAASPAARALARRLGTGLEGIAGTGRGGRVSGADVVAMGAPGAAPTVVLLHGLFDDHRAFRELSRRLAALGHAVVAADLPGHGENPRAAADFDDLCAGVAAQLPPGPVVLAGHSLGGAVAARLAAARRSVAGLVLIAPLGLGARINATFLQGMLHATTPAALARALSELGGGPVSSAALGQELARLSALRPVQTPLAEAVAGGGIQQIDIRADLESAACPLTVVFGTGDRILDWRDVAALPARAAIHLIRGAGHRPHLADPGLVAGLIAGAAVHRQQPETSPGTASGQDADAEALKLAAEAP